MGNWLSFITCLAIIDRYGKASYTSLYFIFRLIPPVCLAGFTGPLADKLNKRDSMVICSLGSCLSVAVLALPWSEHLQLYVVLAAVFVQFSFDALYGPLRQSLIPYVVNEADLQVVTTLVRFLCTALHNIHSIYLSVIYWTPSCRTAWPGLL